jgi:hypothetical protein
MKKNLVIWAMIAVFIFSATGCATIFYPERQGQVGGRVDIVMLCVDLVIFWPGLVIDFITGAIYLPNSYSGGIGNPNNIVPHADGDMIGGYYKNANTGEVMYIVPQKIDRSKMVQHVRVNVAESADQIYVSK